MSLIYDYLKINGKIDSELGSAVKVPPALKKAESKRPIKTDFKNYIKSYSKKSGSRTFLKIFVSFLGIGLISFLAYNLFVPESDVVVFVDPEPSSTMQVQPDIPAVAPEQKVVIQQQEEPVPGAVAEPVLPPVPDIKENKKTIQVFPEPRGPAPAQADDMQIPAGTAAEQPGPTGKKIPQILELSSSAQKITFPEKEAVYEEARQPVKKVAQDIPLHDDIPVQEVYQPVDSQDNAVDISSGATRKSSIADNSFYSPPKPDSTALHRNKKFYQAGLQAQQSGDQRDAEIYYNKALEELPHHLETMINLSALYVQQQRYEEAEIILADILRIDPANSKALVNMGVINLYSYNDPLAEEQFQAALDANPLEENALVNLAYLAEKRQDFEAMERYYRQLLQISPNNVEVLLSYGHLLELEKRYSEAVNLYRDCLKIDIVKKDQQLYDKIAQRMRLLAGAVRR